MRSAVLQFLLAGALVVAWIWMLGRPLLTMLARRSRRDSVGHFRYQQAALGRNVDVEPPDRLLSTLIRPVVEWRAQPLEQRRLQILLGGALATFASALLAIALRGTYIRLFLVMAIGFTAHLLIAAWIGARELRFQEAELRRRTIDAATQRSVGRSVSVGVAEPAIAASGAASDHDDEDLVDLLAGDGLGGGVFEDGFFEPIPELESPSGGRDQGAEESSVAPAASEAGREEPTFTTPTTPRPRQGRRPKGRPIYMEPEHDEGDESMWAVNE